MLLNFRIKNYKSYKELQDFSMISGSTRMYEERLRKEKDYSLLKFSAIYGANGSGKSNLVEALDDMQSLIILGLPKFIEPMYFKLDDACKQEATYFETLLLINDNVYSYGFEYLSYNNKIASEWLVKINKGKKDVELFSRDLINSTFDYNKAYFNGKIKEKLNLYLDELKADNTKLFLSFINSNQKSAIIEEYPEFKYIYDWFEDSLQITGPESILTSGDYFLVDQKIEKLANLLSSFDTGIKYISRVKIDNETAFRSISSKIIDDFKVQASKIKEDNSALEFKALLKSKYGLWTINLENDELSFEKIIFYHDQERKYPFSVYDESEGTVRIIELAETLLTEDNNKLFVIDELDRKLHPQLTCKFVQMFLANAINNDNQLIVTTHESRLLDFDILRRDEIWFVNKETNGESKLYSLEEFNVRFDKKIDKAYLDGRYGGIPIFDFILPKPDNKCQE